MRKRGVWMLLVTVLVLVPSGRIPVLAGDDDGPDRSREAREEVERKMKEPRTDLSTLKSAAIDRAMTDPGFMWSFVTSPDARHTERMAVARRAPLSPDFLPRLVDATAQLDAERRLHYWGMRPHPLDATIPSMRRSLQSLRDLPPEQRNRAILGHMWQIPQVDSDFPVTEAEEGDAPWPWQVQQALNDLWANLRNSRHDDDWCRRWMTEALKLPWSSDADASAFVSAAGACIVGYSPAVLARWMEIVQKPACPEAARRVAMGVRPLDGPLTHAMLADIIEKTPHRMARSQACFELRDLRAPWRKDSGAPLLPPPATGVLAASRIAVDSGIDNSWERLNIAFHVCEAVDNPPFVYRQIDMDSPEVEVYLERFAEWFRRNEARLVAAAEKEKPELDAARAFMKSGAVWKRESTSESPR